MRPLILHNVPDDELYTGEDGIQRPYAMIFPESDRQRDAPRRRAVAETGSFGKSTRRSRSRTGSLPPKREDATMQSADRVFSDYLANQEQAATATGSQRKSSFMAQSNGVDDAASAQPPRIVQEPTEVVLRGYRSSLQQYAAISHYEQLAGRICEDYPRDPPIEQRKYKSELRDPAFTRRQPLTPQERSKVNQVAGGEHWIKITFESADAASAAVYSSPQKILGHLVYAEPYRGLPPLEDAAVVDIVGDVGMLQDEQPLSRAQSLRRQSRGKASPLPKRFQTTPFTGRGSAIDLGYDGSPPESQTSTHTIDSATLSSTTGTASTATITGAALNGSVAADGIQRPEHPAEPSNSEFCRVIPTARRAKVLGAEQALLPRKGLVQRITSRVPLLGWFSGSMIGNEVPRTDSGDFDFNRASLYWQFMWWLDYWFGLFGHEIDHPEKED
ncbi:hypothetical protein JX265_012585 [Neoarthrinium moseri]|uniref:Nucleoporin NUP53 n=1 Tax=Neoarthrinium moseri TaxID=1658444 RepID=A0A9P9WAL3_9PEZI|nr:hypothetical protein JX266_011206 [Neoarthrinium moseri]KAI1853900.1 hypothetical protein JX265_012585 [Neoarthrinium moseri]